MCIRDTERMQNTPQVSGALSIRRQLEFYSEPQQKAKPKNKTEHKTGKKEAEEGIFSARHAIPNRPLKRDALFSNCETNYEIRGDSSQLTRTERLLGRFFSIFFRGGYFICLYFLSGIFVFRIGFGASLEFMVS